LKFNLYIKLSNYQIIKLSNYQIIKLSNYQIIRHLRLKLSNYQIIILPSPMNFNNRTTTITYGDVAENNIKMQQIGQMAPNGFDYNELLNIKLKFETSGAVCELIKLNNLLPVNIAAQASDAYILVIRHGIDSLLAGTTLEYNANQMFMEQQALDHDKKVFAYGKVMNKQARHNLCFADGAQEPDYPNGKGRIIAFQSVPITNLVRVKLIEIIGNKANNLVAEGNYYYDIMNKDVGIGYHGDSERKLVIGVRLGCTMPLCYRWFIHGQPVGSKQTVMLNHGDVYIMSDKAVGHDWKQKNVFTLRHAAGAAKYIDKFD